MPERIVYDCDVCGCVCNERISFEVQIARPTRTYRRDGIACSEGCALRAVQSILADSRLTHEITASAV